MSNEPRYFLDVFNDETWLRSREIGHEKASFVPRQIGKKVINVGDRLVCYVKKDEQDVGRWCGVLKVVGALTTYGPNIYDPWEEGEVYFPTYPIVTFARNHGLPNDARLGLSMKSLRPTLRTLENDGCLIEDALRALQS